MTALVFSIFGLVSLYFLHSFSNSSLKKNNNFRSQKNKVHSVSACMLYYCTLPPQMCVCAKIHRGSWLNMGVMSAGHWGVMFTHVPVGLWNFSRTRRFAVSITTIDRAKTLHDVARIIISTRALHFCIHHSLCVPVLLIKVKGEKIDWESAWNGDANPNMPEYSLMLNSGGRTSWIGECRWCYLILQYCNQDIFILSWHTRVAL